MAREYWNGEGACERGKGRRTKMEKAACRKRKEGWRGWRKACLEN